MKMYDQAMAKQRGVATLVVSVGVALLMAVAAVGMMRSGILEQKIAANDIRAREAQEIAQAGWDYVMASNVNINKKCSDNPIGLSRFVVPSFSPPMATESYLVEFFGCYADINGKKSFRVKSVARSSNAGVGGFAVVEAVFQKKSLLNFDAENIPPPFLIDGNFCVSSKKNEECSGNKNGGILNSRGDLNDPIDSPGVIATGEISDEFIKEIVYEADAAQENVNFLNGKTVWEYVFGGIALADAKVMAVEKEGQPFYYINSNRDNRKTFGASGRPVILIVGKKSNGDCHNFSGGPVIYGVVYFESECNINGWGNSKIYGSIISDGSINKLNANPELHKFNSNTWSAFSQYEDPDGKSFMIPGTWRDFESKS